MKSNAPDDLHQSNRPFRPSSDNLLIKGFYLFLVLPCRVSVWLILIYTQNSNFVKIFYFSKMGYNQSYCSYLFCQETRTRIIYLRSEFHFSEVYRSTVKSAYVVTSIKASSALSSHLF